MIMSGIGEALRGGTVPMGASGALRLRVPRSRAVFALLCGAGLIGAGCSTSAPSPGAQTPAIGSPSAAPTSIPTVSPAAQGAAGCKVGFALDNYGPERYPQLDGPALEQVLDRAGAIYTLSDAKGDVAQQASDIDAFVAAGMDVIIVQPFASGSSEVNGDVPAAVKRATGAGIPVISYDNFLESPDVLYVAFDWVEAGRMEARTILAARPTGKYVVIKGDPASAYANMMRRGIQEVLQPALDSGATKIVGESSTVNWDPFQAEGEMDAILQKNGNRIDAVIVEDDGMASGVIKSLTAAGLAGKVTVASAGGTSGFPSIVTFNAVARGVQTVDVWQDYRQLGKAAAEAAVALCEDRDIANLPGTTRVTSPGGNQLTSILLASQPIMTANLDVVLATGWIKKAELCKDVNPASAPPACR
jgi:D-xylose transport system substrate-binding protein